MHMLPLIQPAANSNICENEHNARRKKERKKKVYFGFGNNAHSLIIILTQYKSLQIWIRKVSCTYAMQKLN